MTGISALRKKMFRGGVWVVLLKLISLPISLLTNIVLVRLLSPKQVGVYFLSLNIIAFIIIIITLGLNKVLLRKIASDIALNRGKRILEIIALAFIITAIGSVLFGILYYVLGPWMANNFFNSQELIVYIPYVIAGFILLALQSLIADALRGFKDIRMAEIFATGGTNLGLITSVLLFITLLVLYLIQWNVNLNTIFGLIVTFALISLITALVALWKKIIQLDNLKQEEPLANIIKNPLLVQLMKNAYPLMLSSMLLFLLNKADIWLVAGFSNEADVAVYGAASRLIALIATPIVMSNAVLPPIIAELESEDKKMELENILRGTALITSVPSVVAFLFLILFGRGILDLIYGDFYISGYSILVSLGIGKVFSVLVGSCGMTLIMSGKEKQVMSITAISTFVTLALSYGLGFYYGMRGVAIGMAMGSILINILRLLVVKIRLGIWTFVGLKGFKNLLSPISPLNH